MMKVGAKSCFKHFLAIVTLFAIVISATWENGTTVNAVLNVNNVGEFAGGSGTEEDPYLIETAEQLNNVRNHLDSHFKMIDDIVFTEEDFAEGGDFYNNGAGWEPIGTDGTTPFTGVFDGNERTITGIYVNLRGNTFVYAGVFGYSGGILKNLGVKESKIYAETSGKEVYYAYSGGIVGYSFGNGIITNCYNIGSVTSSHYAGGICGCICSDGEISNCYNIGKVFSEGEYSFVGGIVGNSNHSIVKDCYNAGPVKSKYYVGGIIGCADQSEISSCYNTANIEGDLSGGIVSSLTDGTIRDCFNMGNIGFFLAGGIANSVSGTIENCYNIGSLSVERDAAGIVRQLLDGTLNNCYYLNTVQVGVVEGEDTAVGLSEEEMRKVNSYSGFDFDRIWMLSKESEYPYPFLKSIADVIIPSENYTDFSGGNGQPYSPYLISNKEELNNARYYLGSCFKLINNIIFTEEDFVEGGEFYNDGAGWEPIGKDATAPFFGTFDGNGYAISGLKVKIGSSRENKIAKGLFGVNIGRIQNLTVQESNFNWMFDGETYIDLGSIAGENEGIIENCFSLNNNMSGYPEDQVSAGGIVGTLCQNGIIQNCANTSEITARYVGGIVGDIWFGGIISNCYNSGKISTTVISGELGGISGRATDGAMIENCYNTGTIDSIGQWGEAGGIAGNVSELASVRNCYNTGTVRINELGDAGGIVGVLLGELSTSYNAGSIVVINGTDVGNLAVGGVAGNVNEFGSHWSIYRCYYLDNISQGTSGEWGDVRCLSSSEMEKADSFLDFDFDTIWTMEGNEDYLYPELRTVPMQYEKTAESIELTALPDKLEYVTQRDQLDVTGGKIMVKYADHTEEEINLTAEMVSGFDNTQIGKQTLTVTYQDCTTTFDIMIKGPGIEVGGTLTTYGSESDVTLELYRDGEAVPTYTTKVSNTTGKTTYSFPEVEAGNYTLKVSKSKHCTREYSITVEDAVITQNVVIRLYGDVLLDGKVNNNDAIQIKRYVNQKTGVLSDLEGEELSYVLKVADVYSADGKVNNNDAIQIQRYVNLKPSIFDSIL